MSCQVRKAVTCRLRKRLIPHGVAREYNVARTSLGSRSVRESDNQLGGHAPRSWIPLCAFGGCRYPGVTVKSASLTTATDRSSRRTRTYARSLASAGWLARSVSGRTTAFYLPSAGPLHAGPGRQWGRYTELRLAGRAPITLPRGRLRDIAPPRKSWCDTIIELWAAPERHRSARLAPVTGTPLLRRARPARGAERTIDPSGGHSPAVQRAHLMWLCLPQDLRHTSTAHLARTPCVAEPGYLIELCSQRSRTYPHTGHPHGHPQTGSDNRV
jgi:hypothetical protein